MLAIRSQKDPYPHDDRAIENAINWLETKAGIGKPFAMVINILAPHFPHYCHQSVWKIRCGRFAKYGVEAASAQHPRPRATEALSGQAFPERQYTVCDVDTMRIDYVDQLGRIMEALDKAGIS